MSRSRSRKFADIMSSSIASIFDNEEVASEDVAGLHTVATSGSYNDLTNKPAPFDPSTLATAAQGALADTALQPTTTTWANIKGETASSVNSWGGLRHKTNDGYIDFGPANSGWAHIYTDRPGFYFNKDLYVNGTKITKSTSVNAVGTYAWLGGSTTSIRPNPGNTFAGSTLRYAGTSSTATYSDNTAARIGKSSPTTPSGTWRAMGGTGSVARYNTTLFVRIS